MAIDIIDPDKIDNDFGNSSNWNLNNGAVTIPSRFQATNTAGRTDGVNDMIISLSGTMGLSQSSGENHTFAFWVTGTDATVNVLIASQINRAAEATGNAWEWKILSGGISQLRFTNGGSSPSTDVRPVQATFNDGNPHLIMIAVSNKDIQFFVDGVNQALALFQNGGGFTGVNATCNEEISFGSGASDTNFYEGDFDRPRYWNATATDQNASDYYDNEVAAMLKLSNFDLVTFARNNYFMNDSSGSPTDSLESRDFLVRTGSPINTGAGISYTGAPNESQGDNIASGPSPFRYNLGNTSYIYVFQNKMTEAQQDVSRYIFGTKSSPGGAMDLFWKEDTQEFQWALSGFQDTGARFDFVLGRYMVMDEIIAVVSSRQDIGDGYHAAFETSEGDKGSATRTGTSGQPGENRGVYINSNDALTSFGEQLSRRLITSWGRGHMRIVDVEVDAALAVAIYSAEISTPLRSRSNVLRGVRRR